MSRGHGNVLLVCERPVSDPVIDTVSRELGQVLVRAGTAADGLALARDTDFALILAGYAGNAAELADTVRSLCALPRVRHTPIIVLGIPADPGFALEPLYEAGAIAAIAEPISPTILKAKARFYLATFENARERRRAEAELRRLAHDLAEADRLKTEFLATLAHELRNPLAPIRTGLQLMRRAGDDPATRTRVQDIMDRQLDHLVHLVDDLLDVARITRGQVELKRAWVDLAQLVSAAVEISRPLVDAGRHQLEVHLPPEPVQLYADQTRITQVISNLLNNAARYTPRGGRIVLAAEREDACVRISVADNGVGIARGALAGVFKLFTQGGSSAGAPAGAQGGLGIGLSLVRTFVELHGGSVAVASDGPGTGALFTVRLPLHPAGAPARPVAHGGTASGAGAGPLRLLVVDDNRDAAETLAALLDVMGHATAIANDGAQALRLVQSFQPQAVFLDIGMPGMSGYDVAQAIRREHAFDGVLLVALTGWGAEPDRARSAGAGFDAHLTKPATIEAIGEVLARLTVPHAA